MSDYRFGDFLTINLDNVSSNEREELERVFDSVASVELHSILERYRLNNEVQIKIDLAISKVLNLGLETAEIIDLQSIVYNELLRLRKVMA